MKLMTWLREDVDIDVDNALGRVKINMPGWMMTISVICVLLLAASCVTGCAVTPSTSQAMLKPTQGPTGAQPVLAPPAHQEGTAALTSPAAPIAKVSAPIVKVASLAKGQHSPFHVWTGAGDSAVNQSQEMAATAAVDYALSVVDSMSTTEIGKRKTAAKTARDAFEVAYKAAHQSAVAPVKGEHSPFVLWAVGTDPILTTQEAFKKTCVDYGYGVIDSITASKIATRRALIAPARDAFEAAYTAPPPLPPGHTLTEAEFDYAVACEKLFEALQAAQGGKPIPGPQAQAVLWSLEDTWEDALAAQAQGPISFLTLDPNMPPPTIVFSVSPSSIQQGGTATLTWAVANATGVSILPGPTGIGMTGSLNVSPTTTTQYQLTAAGNAVITQSVTLTVTPADPTVTFSAIPTNILSGGVSQLTWTTTNAASVSIDNSIGTVPTSGISNVNPITTTTYVITVNAANGKKVSASVTVGVTGTPLPGDDTWPPPYPSGNNPPAQPEQPIPDGALVLVPGTDLPTRVAVAPGPNGAGVGTAIGLPNPDPVDVAGHTMLPWDGVTMTSAGFRYGTSGWDFNLYDNATGQYTLQPEHVEYSLDGGAWQATRTQQAMLPIGMSNGVHQVRIVSWPRTGKSFPWQPIYVKRVTQADGTVTWALYQ